MRSLYTEEKVILNILSNRWIISVYELYGSTALSVGQIVQFVKIYKEKGYIKNYRYIIFKTLKGYWKIKQMVPELYRMSDKSWKQAPADYFNKPIARDAFPPNSKLKDF